MKNIEELTTIKIPIEIIKVTDPDNIERYRATITLKNALEESYSTKNLIEIQNDYSNLIKECKKLHKKITSSRKNQSNPGFHWQLANKIFQFAKSLEGNNYIFANFTDAMIRDLGLSKTYINKLLTFRTYYPSFNLINEKINWSKYRELLEISNKNYRERCEKKITNGELRNEQQIREFKKSIKRQKKL